MSPEVIPQSAMAPPTVVASEPWTFLSISIKEAQWPHRKSQSTERYFVTNAELSPRMRARSSRRSKRRGTGGDRRLPSRGKLSATLAFHSSTCEGSRCFAR
jgi:hypothetical protein